MGVDWNYVVEDGDQWRALVNMLMKLPVPYNAGIFLLAEKVLGFEERSAS
jgi:hypothetical protein